jgi:hypothetical protein
MVLVLFWLLRTERSLARGVRQAPLSLGRGWDAGCIFSRRARVSRAPTRQRVEIERQLGDFQDRAAIGSDSSVGLYGYGSG